MNDVKKWINIAKSDIKSSKILYEKGLYSQSYFYFQQASEKANKAYWLYDGILDESQLIKIGHNQFKPLRKNIVSEKNKIDYLRDFQSTTNLLFDNSLFTKNDIDEYENHLNKTLKFIDGFKRVNSIDFEEEQLSEMLEILKDLKKLKPKIPQNFSNLIKQRIKDLIAFIEKIDTEIANEQVDEFYKLLNNKNEFDNYINSLKKSCEKLISIFYTSTIFRFCSILTVQHSSSTRYPEGHEGQSPIITYNKRLPIVKKQLKFLEHLDRALNQLVIFSKNYEPKKNKDSILNQGF